MTAVVRPNARIPILAGAVVLLLAVVAIAVSAAGGDGGGAAAVEENRAVAVEGSPLAGFDGSNPDPVLGTTAPTVTGRSFDGARVVAGEPAQLVVFLAHWCPHCQREVPVIRDWLAAGGAVDGVGVVAVSTSVLASAPNYPPSAWLEREDWPLATLADDDLSTTATAFGITSYPAFVAIGPDGTVAARGAGELAVAQLEDLLAAARG